MNGFSDIFLYFSLALVVLWTVRMAKSKGKNPLLWGGASFLLMLVPLLISSWPTLLGMAPMVVLLFLKSPQTRAEEPVPESVTCPKCNAYHVAGHTYCVNCGWELNRPYSESPGQAVGAATVPQVQREAQAEPEAVERTTTDTPITTQPAEPEPVVATVSDVSVSDASVSMEENREDIDKENSDEVLPEPVPPKPVVSRPITPARFTEHGIDLLERGKFQEAVDQFSKAIALDSTYSSAWENRAEAYARLGRDSKAAEDRQRLQEFQKNPAGQ